MCVLYPKCPNIAWILTTLCYFQLGYWWQLQIKLHFRRRKNLLQFFPLFKLSLGFTLSLTSRLIKLPGSDWFRFIWTHTDHLSLWKCHINSPQISIYCKLIKILDGNQGDSILYGFGDLKNQCNQYMSVRNLEFYFYLAFKHVLQKVWF